MKRALRWIKRIVLGVMALAFLAVAITIGAVHTDWGRNKLRTTIVAELQADFPGSTIASIAGSPFGTLILRGVTLNGRDGKPMVTIERIEVEARLRPLVHKRVHVDRIALTTVDVFVREQPPKPASTTPPSTAPSEPSAWTIELPSISVDGGRVFLESPRGREVIDKLAITAAVQIPAGQPIAASANVRGTWRGKPLTATAWVATDAITKIPFAVATLGDARVVASGVEITTSPGLAVTGAVHAHVPAALVKELAAQDLPADIELAAHARGNGAITLAVRAGLAHLDADVIADLVNLRARGIVTAEAHDLAPFTQGKVTGHGTVVAAISADRERVRGLVTVFGTIEGEDGTTTLALDATRTHAELVASGRAFTGSGAAHAVVDGTGDTWTLTDATVRAQAANVEGVRDARVNIRANGPLYPRPHLAFTGAVDALGYRMDGTSVGSVHVDLTGTATRERQQLSTRVTATKIQKGTTRIPSARLASNTVVEGGTIDIALGAHEVRTQDGARWSGTGGTVQITDAAFDVRNVRTGTGGSTVTATANVSRLDDSLTATVTARDVSLAIADPTLRGTADADLDITQRGSTYRGKALVRATGVTLPDKPPVDATVAVTLNGRKITVDGSVTNPQLGTTTLAASLTGPRVITDARAWQRLPRTALDQVSLSLAELDGAPLGVRGRVDGQLRIDGAGATGTLHVSGIDTKAGPLAADVTIAPADGGAIRVDATARVPELPPATATATLVLPAYPFDPRAWKALGPDALREAVVALPAMRIDPTVLARIGVISPYQADVDATITVTAGAKSATVAANVKGLAGGRLTAPVDIALKAETGATGTTANVEATSGKLAVAIVAKSPLTVEGVLASGVENAKNAKLDIVATVPDIAAKDLLGLLGETDVLAGSVGGTLTVSGSLNAPAVRAQIAASGFAMKGSSITNKQPPNLERLELDAKWTRERAEVRLTGREGPDRLLEITASGDPRNPRSVIASIQAANFDLAPLAAFGTGPIRAARGTLNAALAIKGLDPQTGSIRGMLAIKDARFPLSPELGTLRRANLELDVIKNKLVAKFDGRLGAGGGNISGEITSDVVGGMPMNAVLAMKLRKVSPIGAMQPQIDADITGSWANEGAKWAGSVRVRNGKIYIPPEAGSDLLITGAPSDMIFIDKQTTKKKGRRQPTKTWLSTRIAIGNTDIDVEDTDFRVRVVARGDLILDIGDGMSVKGQIATTRGNVDLVGRRYRVEQAVVDFDDGTFDPRLDIRVVHDFKNLTLTAEVHGRASDPIPDLSADRGNYTEGQLLSFVAGAEPGEDDSTAQANQAAVSGGLAILSGRIGRKVNQYLPVKFDSISYEAGTSSSSKAVRLGLQLTERSYLVYRQHVAPRPDENTGEAVFEYQFRNWLLFETTVGERNKGGDFLFRHRW